MVINVEEVSVDGWQEGRVQQVDAGFWSASFLELIILSAVGLIQLAQAGISCLSLWDRQPQTREAPLIVQEARGT